MSVEVLLWGLGLEKKRPDIHQVPKHWPAALSYIMKRKAVFVVLYM